MLKLNKESYQQLIDEDRAWLLQFPDTQERKHIECVLRDSVFRLYPNKEIPTLEVIKEDDGLHFNCYNQQVRD